MRADEFFEQRALRIDLNIDRNFADAHLRGCSSAFRLKRQARRFAFAGDHGRNGIEEHWPTLRLLKNDRHEISAVGLSGSLRSPFVNWMACAVNPTIEEVAEVLARTFL